MPPYDHADAPVARQTARLVAFISTPHVCALAVLNDEKIFREISQSFRGVWRGTLHQHVYDRDRKHVDERETRVGVETIEKFP